MSVFYLRGDSCRYSNYAVEVLRDATGLRRDKKNESIIVDVMRQMNFLESVCAV